MNTASQLEKKNYYKEILDWMESRFDGDLDGLVKETMLYLKKKQYIFGPLWEEIGDRMIRILFKERLRNERNNFGVASTVSLNNQIKHEVMLLNTRERGRKARHDVQTHNLPANPSASIYLEWYCVGKKWIQLGDMTKSDCLLLSDDYRQRAKSNEVNAVFFNKVADKLSGNQTVKDAISEDEIKLLKANIQD